MASSRSKRAVKANRVSRNRAGDYLVGYGKPPVATRFKPGQSGNPKGRPKRHRNLRTVLENTLNQRVTLREGERNRLSTKLEALAAMVTNRALNGDPRAVASLITLMRASGMVDEPPAPLRHEPITDQDADLLADYFARHADPSPGVCDEVEEPERSGDPEPKGSQDHRDPDQPPPASRRGR